MVLSVFNGETPIPAEAVRIMSPNSEDDLEDVLSYMLDQWEALRDDKPTHIIIQLGRK